MTEVTLGEGRDQSITLQTSVHYHGKCGTPSFRNLTEGYFLVYALRGHFMPSNFSPWRSSSKAKEHARPSTKSSKLLDQEILSQRMAS